MSEFDRASLIKAAKILNLPEDLNFTETDVQTNWRKIIERVHPDGGGTTFLAEEVNNARDILIKWLKSGERPQSNSNQRFQDASSAAADSVTAEAKRRANVFIAVGWILALICGLSAGSNWAAIRAGWVGDSDSSPFFVSALIYLAVSAIYAAIVFGILKAVALLPYFRGFMRRWPNVNLNYSVGEWASLHAVGGSDVSYKPRFQGIFGAVSTALLIGIIFFSGPTSPAVASAQCKIEKHLLESTMIPALDANNSPTVDFGYVQHLTVKNVGGQGQIKVRVELSTPEGNFSRERSLTLDQGEIRSADIQFPEPTIASAASEVQASVECK